MYEPKNNTYGRWRVLARTDGRFIVHDPSVWPPPPSAGRLFASESDARGEALDRARRDNPAYVHPPGEVSAAERREWMAASRHVAWCPCVRCRESSAGSGSSP